MRWPRAIGTKWSDKMTVHCNVQSSGAELPGRKAAKYIQWLQLSELVLFSTLRKHKSWRCFKMLEKRSNEYNVFLTFFTLVGDIFVSTHVETRSFKDGF